MVLRAPSFLWLAAKHVFHTPVVRYRFLRGVDLFRGTVMQEKPSAMSDQRNRSIARRELLRWILKKEGERTVERLGHIAVLRLR